MTARVQNSGLARITAGLAGVAWYFGWGTGSSASAAANDVTTAGTDEARVAATPTRTTTNVANDCLQLVGTITADAPRTITELGVFDALTAGSMDIYTDFGVVTLDAGDSITFTLKTTFQ